jgi:hypothetical protein
MRDPLLAVASTTRTLPRKPRDDAVSLRKMMGQGPFTGRVLRHHETLFADPLEKLLVFGGITDIDPASQDGYGP